ncbi:alpha/beta hydrolase [Mycobacterium sp. NPDC003449]
MGGVAGGGGSLGAFYATWDKARETYGQGTPEGGSQFEDSSARFTDVASDLEGAAPGAHWSSGAADGYDASNTRQRGLVSRIADIDRRLGAQIDESARVVATGRQNLDAVRQWVDAAAASAPAGRQRETVLTQIASRGLEDLRAVVQQTTTEQNFITRQVNGLKGEYEALTFKESPELPGDDEPGKQDDPTKTDMSSGDIEAIDRANRELLQRMLDEYQQLPDGQVKTDRLADIAAIRDALKVPDSHLVYLEKPDDPSQMIPAATSVGDPFTADHVSVTVPGVSGTTRGTIEGMTREAAQLRNEATSIVEAERMDGNHSVAAVAWVGYQPPPNLGDSSVLNDDLAQAGAPKLTSFLGELDAASKNPGQTTALFGHSYGSLTSGIALKEGASEYIDNAVLYGSPGFQATTPADLGMNDDNFFVMAASDDPINYIADLAPLHGWGSNPNDVIDDDGRLRFRFQHLETDAGVTPIEGYESKTGASGHSDYGRDAGERMSGYNLAAILLDRPDLTVKETPYSW